MAFGRTRHLRWAAFPMAVALATITSAARQAAPADSIAYTIRIPDPGLQVVDIEATFPTDGAPAVDLMMAVWSPGFYRVENYATRVQSLSASTPAGIALTVEQPAPNRWRIGTGGEPAVVVTYRLLCQGRSVTTNWVGEDYAIFNGPATFITLADEPPRPHEVRLELPPEWSQSATSLDVIPGTTHEYIAPDFDVLADSPIVAGRLRVHEFDVAGSVHALVDFGEVDGWDGARAAERLARIAGEQRRLMGGLPFRRYVFLNALRRGGGGLEHLNSTLLTTSPGQSDAPTLRWLKFASHEYFHAFNVKRLRPVELGPFDYEQPPSTASLWIAEGLTTYYGDLAVVRAGLGTVEDHLSGLSSQIRQLQTSPGRLRQTLEQSSLDVWTGSSSGVGVDTSAGVSYYVKGAVVGLLLDARIRRITGGRRSLDDVMRLAYARYSGERGFTPPEFQAVVADVVGADLSGFFRLALASTDELDYGEMLDWFGLRFAEPGSSDPERAWALEVRPDATPEQASRLERWLTPGRQRP